MSTGNFTVLTTTEASSRALLLFDLDGTTFVVDNTSNTYVCNDSHLLSVPLIDFNVTLDTVNGNRGFSLKTSPICIAWENDSGKNIEYEIQEVVYNPSSPFNILSVGRFGKHFKSINCPPTNNKGGTWVNFCVSYTDFTWDRGRFTRRFYHFSDGVPELSVNTESSTISTF